MSSVLEDFLFAKNCMEKGLFARCPMFNNCEECKKDILLAYKQQVQADVIDKLENWLHKRILRTIPIEYEELVKVLEQMREKKE